jgi:hypothetical protein
MVGHKYQQYGERRNGLYLVLVLTEKDVVSGR